MLRLASQWVLLLELALDLLSAEVSVPTSGLLLGLALVSLLELA